MTTHPTAPARRPVQIVGAEHFPTFYSYNSVIGPSSLPNPCLHGRTMNPKLDSTFPTVDDSVNKMLHLPTWKQFWCVAMAGGIVFVGADSDAAPEVNQPNFVILIADDLNDSVSGMGGHPQARTPHLNRLAAGGLRMQNAHCTVPVCGPSRASLWTGLSPLRTGYYGYQQQKNHWRKFEAMEEATTLMENLGERGYEVMGTGKVFHNGHEDNTVFTREVGIRPSFGPAPWDGVSYHPWDQPEGQGHPRMPGSRSEHYWPGFGPLSDIPEVEGWKGWMADWHDGAVGKAESWRYRWESPEDRDPMPDELNAVWASQRLMERSAEDEPFCLIVGFNRPHTPMYVPDEFFDLWDPAEIEFPAYLPDDLEDIPKILWRNPQTGERNRYANRLPELMRQGESEPEGGFEWWRRWIHAYLASTAFVDHQVGVVLDALEASAVADSTYVVFISDHGYHMGQKDHLFKRTLWEESTRVPMVWKGPGIPEGRESSIPVSLLDIYPTLLDIAGLSYLPEDPEDYLDGLSLEPLLWDPDLPMLDRRRGVLTHINGHRHLPPHTFSPVSWNHHSVRTERYRYSLSNDGGEELYDHQKDPHEWDNRAGDPEYADIQAELAAYLRSRMQQFKHLEPPRP